MGRLHITEDASKTMLPQIKLASGVDELMYIGTCNRVEFILVTEKKIDNDFLSSFFKSYGTLNSEDIKWAIENANIFEGPKAISHLFSVASSIDSLVVGEREIITQVRNAYEFCRNLQLTGDRIRLVIKKTIETAKRIYTETNIAKNPVSVMSLAYRMLRDLNAKLDSRIVIVGAGETNSILSKYLRKHGFKNFSIYNRTLSKAQLLSQELGGNAFALDELKNHNTGFDVLVTCAAAPYTIITKEVYQQLLNGEKGKKIIIDLAVPNNVDERVVNEFPAHYIAVSSLNQIAKVNLLQREKELVVCEKIIQESLDEFKTILKTRQLELAMSDVPKKVKEIRDTATNEVFAKDIEQLDPQSKEVLQKVLDYVEKKYISVPMKMAREILIED